MKHKNHQHIILVADDDEEFRLLVRSTLELSDYIVVEAGNGVSAMKKYRSLHPSLVLLDVMMPDLDGFEVCKEIRHSPNGLNTPIVMITSLDDVESIQKAYQLGATDFLTKPVDWQMLTLRVNFLLRAHQKIMQSIQIAIEAASHPDIQHKSGVKNPALDHLERQLGPQLLKEFLSVIDDSIQELKITEEEKVTAPKKSQKKNAGLESAELLNMLPIHVQEMQTGIEFIHPYMTWILREIPEMEQKLHEAASNQNVLLWIQTLLRLKPHCDYVGYKPLSQLIDKELIAQTDNLLASMEQNIQTVQTELDRFLASILKEMADNGYSDS